MNKCVLVLFLFISSFLLSACADILEIALDIHEMTGGETAETREAEKKRKRDRDREVAKKQSEEAKIEIEKQEWKEQVEYYEKRTKERSQACSEYQSCASAKPADDKECLELLQSCGGPI